MAKGAKQDTENTNLNSITTNTNKEFLDVTATGTLSAINQEIFINCERYNTVIVTRSGTFTGTIVAVGETATPVSFPNNNMDFIQENAGQIAYQKTTQVVSSTLRYIINVAHLSKVRIVCTSYTAGSLNVTLEATNKSFYDKNYGAGDWTLTTIPIEATPFSTVAASITGLVPAATPTDIFVISGINGSAKAKVRRVEITATKTSAGVVDILLIKRTTLDTGGSFTSPTQQGLYAFSGQATVKAFTANPTALGTGTVIRSAKMLIGPTTLDTQTIVWEFGEGLGAPIILSNGNHGLCVNLNGVTQTGASFDISVQWDEG